MRLAVFLLLFPAAILSLHAQNCGFQGRKPIFPDSITRYTIQVFDHAGFTFSGSQRVDSIFLHFRSPELSTLRISLISPDGDTVRLIGPFNEFTGNDVLGGTYRIRFVPTNIASVDTLRWSNALPGLPPNTSRDTIFFPYEGNLQDFKGNVNGTWTILIDTRGSENELFGFLNEILDFRILFANRAGDHCCLADAGSLPDSTFSACAGDTRLVTLPKPVFSLSPPDTSRYGYGYAVFLKDTLFELTATPDLRNLPPGEYKVRGFSFQKGHLDKFRQRIGKISISGLAQLVGNPLTRKDTCGAMGSGTFSFTLTPADCVKKLTWLIPPGDSVAFAGSFRKDQGTYRQAIPRTGKCDSITEMTLIIRDRICPKVSYKVADSTFRQEGDYTVPLRSVSGCDSIVNLRLRYYSRSLQLKDPPPLTCVRKQITLDARGTASAFSIQLLWDKVQGSPLEYKRVAEGENPTVSENGLYALTIRYENKLSCLDTFLAVTMDTIQPIPVRGLVPVFTCRVDSVTMGSSLTSQGPEFAYFWTAPRGRLGTIRNARFAQALSPGDYRLRVVNTLNGCADSLDLTVGADTLRPKAIGGGDKILTCGSPTVVIGSNFSDGGNGFDARWFVLQSDGISFFSTPRQKTQSINAPGLFRYRVEDSNNGCKDSATVRVTIDTVLPVLRLPLSDTLSCTTGKTVLKASLEGNTDRIRYNWQATLGAVLEARSASLLRPEVFRTGRYSLQVLDTFNRCTREAEITITENCKPRLLFRPPDSINCNREFVRYTAGIANPNPALTYIWDQEPSPGCLHSEQQTLQMEAKCPGTYRLIARNPVFGYSDTLRISIVEDKEKPRLVIAEPDTIDCQNKKVELNASASSSGSRFLYIWLGASGDTVSTAPRFFTDKAETYTLEITNRQNGCMTAGQKTVVQDASLPVIRLASAIYPCNRDSFAYAAQVSPLRERLRFRWSGVGIYRNADSLQVWISRPGKYFLEVSDPSQGCVVTDSVQIGDQPCPPCVRASGTPDTLTCARRQTSLRVNLCRPCEDCSFRWVGPQGGVVPGDDFRSQRVEQPGTYTLIAQAANGLISELQITVVGDLNPPALREDAVYTLTCRTDSIVLEAPVLRKDTSYGYRWQPPVGERIAVLDGFSVVAKGPGLYQVYVTNQRNACINLAEITVRVNRVKPRAEAGPDKTLTCTQTRLNLDGTASSRDVGTRFSYQWEGLKGGRILGGKSTLTPLLSDAGTYFLSVTDEQNGCFATDSATVYKDIGLPPVPSFNDSTLLCRKRELVYQGILPSGGGFAGRWCELDTLGNATRCVEDLRKIFSAGGLYRFEVTNKLTGCVNGISVQIREDFNSPAVDYPSRDTLRCDKPILRLKPTLQGDTSLYFFNWTTVSGRAMIENTQVSPRLFREDIYRIQITDRYNGCTRMDTFFLKADLIQPLVSAGKDTLLTCSHPTIKLQATAKTGSGQARYRWFSENSSILADPLTATPSVNKPGLFWLIVEDSANACQAADIVEVSDGFNKPRINLNLADGLILSCIKDSLRLDASSSSSAYGYPLRITWEATAGQDLASPQERPVIVVRRTGKYAVRAVDRVTGCEANLPVEVIGDFLKPGFILADTFSLSCRIKEVSLSPTALFPSNAVLKWTPPRNLIPDLRGSTLLARDTGWYKLTLTRPDNGCSFNDSALVRYDTRPIGLVVEKPLTLNCSRLQTLITVKVPNSLPYRYLWTTKNGELYGSPLGPSAQARKAGEYRVVVEEVSSGCTEEANVQVIYLAPEIDSVLYQVIAPGCIGGPKGELKITRIVGGTPPFSTYLSNSGALQRLELTSPGPQTLIIIDSLGCRKEIPFTVPEPAIPRVALGKDTVIVAGDSLLLGKEVPVLPGSVYRWTPAVAGADTRTPLLRVAPVNTTLFRLEITASNGCKATDAIQVRVVQQIEVYAPSAFSPDGDGMNDFFTLFAPGLITEISTLRVFHRTGNLLFDGKGLLPNVESQGWDGKHRGVAMLPGVYVYQALVKRRDGKLFPLQGTVTLLK